MEYSATGNASINLNDTTIFSRFFIMMFRPLFYDARDIYQIVISIENLALIFWFSFALIQSIKRGYHHIFKVSKVALFFGVAGLLLWVFYSTYIYNLGLASRMKATIIPLLFICFQDFFAKTIKKSNFVDID